MSSFKLLGTNYKRYSTKAIHFKETVIWNNMPAVIKSISHYVNLNKKSILFNI